MRAPPKVCWSGAGLRQGVEGPGDRLCVGEPGRLSLEETEWWRPEEKLRLLCITVLPFDSFFKIPRRLWKKKAKLVWKFVYSVWLYFITGSQSGILNKDK